MKIKTFIRFVVVLSCSIAMWGCGSLGEGTTAKSTQPVASNGTTQNNGTPAPEILISGTALDAKNGTVKITALKSDGSLGSVLASNVAVDANGKFSTPVPKNSGAVIVEAIGANQILTHTLTSISSGNAIISVSSLSELAYQKTLATSLSTVNFATAVTVINALFHVSDITTVATSDFSSPFVSENVKNATLANAAIAALVASGTSSASIASAIDTINKTIDPLIVQSIKTELATLLDNPNNKTNVTSIDSYVTYFSSLTAVIKIKTKTTTPTTTIKGIQMTLTLPTGSIFESAELSGSAPANAQLTANSTAGKVVIYLTPAGDAASLLAGIPAGEVVTIRCKLPLGVPNNNLFTLTNFKAFDSNGATIQTVSTEFDYSLI